jgi:hypothetical protein
VSWKFDEDKEFVGARNTLDRRMTDMQKRAGDATVKATPFTEEELAQIFESDLLSMGTPIGLLTRLFFVIGLNTAAQIKWHNSIKWTEISEAKEDDGGIIVIYAPRENMDPLSPEAILTPEA